MRFTILGAAGFIGGALARSLKDAGHEVLAPGRDDPRTFAEDLGHVVHAAGVTADFRSRPYDALRAHATLTADLLERARFDSLLYLSTARLYRHADSGRETAAIRVRSEDPEDLHDLTKLAGEALCHASGRASVRVARLSSVVGPDFESSNFVTDLVRSACDDGAIVLRSDPRSAKDYVLLEDVLDVLPRLAVEGRHACTNVGSGVNVSHEEILAPIVAATGATWSVAPGAPLIRFPPLDVSRLREDLAFVPRPVVPRIESLVRAYRSRTRAQD